MSESNPIQQQTSAVEYSDVVERLYAFILPNEPKTNGEIEAFIKACEAQYSYEQKICDTVDLPVFPDGMSEFAIGNFSMRFGDGVKSSLSLEKGICKTAYAILLRAGLLYRGIA